MLNVLQQIGIQPKEEKQSGLSVLSQVGIGQPNIHSLFNTKNVSQKDTDTSKLRTPPEDFSPKEKISGEFEFLVEEEKSTPSVLEQLSKSGYSQTKVVATEEEQSKASSVITLFGGQYQVTR